MAVQRGRSKRRGEAYFEYVEPLNDARTKLADFFNILLDHSHEWRVETEGKSHGAPREDLIIGQPEAEEEMVCRCHEAERRTRFGTRRIHQVQREPDRRLAQALGDTEPASQGDAVSIGYVDAEFPHQSRRQIVDRRATCQIGASEGRIAQIVRENRKRHTQTSEATDKDKYDRSDAQTTLVRMPPAAGTYSNWSLALLMSVEQLEQADLHENWRGY